MTSQLSIDIRCAALRRELEDHYTLRDRTAHLAGRRIALTQVQDLDELLERVDVLDEDERLPYWAEYWPSAFALADYLLRGDHVRGRTVVEIGCGMGLVGLAAGLAGAEVVLTDYDPHALLLAELNLLQNGVTGATTALLDWRCPELGGTFDVLLAADILYERRSFEPVLGAIRDLLSPTGVALVAEPGREVARAFFEDLERSSVFRVNRREHAMSVPGEPDVRIAIWEIGFKLYAG